MSDIEHEIEVKILMSTSELQKVFDAISPSAVDGKIKEKHRPRAYFDTHKRKISKLKMALRVQYKEGIGYEQTLKYEVASNGDDANGKMSRIEIKNVLKKGCETPDLSLIDLSIIEDKLVRRAIKNLSEKKLEHVFTASVKRKYFVVPVVENGEEIGKVELAFDPGKIVHAVEKDLFKDVSEVEVEFKSGDTKAVDIMCRRILDMVKETAVSTVSKAQMGYDLDDQAKARESKSKDVGEALAEDCKDLPKKSKKMLPK